MKSKQPCILPELGVFGYDEVEPVILAALITGDPLLLIGKSGTGKTYLLNSLSEAFGLVHRHYNASLIAFDDLVGFPYPDDEKTCIRYLETPSTIWQAESVLVDEISRCKPEHQNRLFSLVHERMIQGLPLERLRYRWAAMNPCYPDQGPADEQYEGSVPLDPALADRFSFVVEVPDWQQLSGRERDLVADPRGEGLVSTDTPGLKEKIEQAADCYAAYQQAGQAAFRTYAVCAADMLGLNRLRISPRRVRQLVRNLHAVAALRGGSLQEKDFELVLTWSLPHRAWGVRPEEAALRAAHRTAWDKALGKGSEAWLNRLLLERAPHRIVRGIVKSTPNKQMGTLAVSQALRMAGQIDRAVLSFALYPAALEGRLKITREAVRELGRIADAIVRVNGEINWVAPPDQSIRSSGWYRECSNVLARRRGRRRERAKQLFYHLLVNDIIAGDAAKIEEEFNRCVCEVRTLYPRA